jgi:lysophospholipase L1-like esterase
MNPFEHLQELNDALNNAEASLQSRLSAEQAEPVLEKFSAMRQQLREMQQKVTSLLEQSAGQQQRPLWDEATAAKLETMRKNRSGLQERFDALNARLPKLPPLEDVPLLDGHTLGKQLLVELQLVRRPQQEQPKRPAHVDETGFRWESSNEWDAFGI